MNDDALRTHRLVRWNRFWLVLVALYTLVAGFNYLGHRITSNANRLQLTWGTDESPKGENALVFSSAQGGPFIVTGLVIGSNSGDTALGAIAELPRPLFVRGPKAHTYFSTRQMEQLVWITPEGEKVAAPKPNTAVMALYSETRKVVTTEE
jgi:hypothetical protein